MKTRAYILAIALLSAMGPRYGFALQYVPFNGNEGYQEIEVDQNTFYVAFHGSKTSKEMEVDTAWHARAAELCSARGANGYIALRYLFEPVLKAKAAATPNKIQPSALGRQFIPVGVLPYIILDTSPPEEGRVWDAPSHLGHVRCVLDRANMRDPSRILDVRQPSAK